MHLNFGQFFQHVRNVFQCDPIILDVLARRHVTIAAIIIARDLGQLAHPHRVQLAIGNGHAQHIGVQLQIDAVLQAQRFELVFQDLAGQAAFDLTTELIHAFLDDLRVKFIIAIHSIVSTEAGSTAHPERIRRMICLPEARLVLRLRSG